MDEHNYNHPPNLDKIDPGQDYVELESVASRQPSLDRGSRYDYAGPTMPPTPKKINELDENMPLGKAIRKFPKITAYCLAMAVAIVGWGYSLLIISAMNGVDTFKDDYGEKYKGKQIIPKLWLSLWMAMPPAGSAIGSLFGGWLQDRIGRRFSVMTGSVISAVAVALTFFSFLPKPQDGKRIMVTGGMVVQGMSVGILQTTCTTFVSENAPTSLQGPAMAIFPTFTLLGQLFGSIAVFLVQGVNGNRGYLSAFASMWVLSIASFIISCFMPDSPIYLLRKGQDAKAIVAASRLYAPKVSQYTAIERFRTIIEEERALTANATYLTCFNRRNIRRTMIVLLAGIMPALFGLDLLSSANVFLQVVGMETVTSLLLLVGGIVAGMLSNGVGIWVLSRVGLRTLTMVTLGITACLWGAMGVSGFWTGNVAIWIAGGLMISVIVVCGVGAWPASFAYIGQTSSMQLRATTTALSGVVAQGASVVMNLVLPQLYNPDGGNLGAKTAFIYTGLCIIALVLSWFFLPEMKDRTVSEIDTLFAMKLPTRQFKYWKLEKEEGREDALPLTRP